ncbi:hypothetical protein SLEP1_g39024 [Rubroshorea leprosula]|uniref:Uncharacterized protein n=1 Tax=Rubroshorea leprosula TaxID=152421 RepID=A0AAV5KZ01_9ROSI|nr:hypothetical protein SLEP1_g39024 [Rubroshorea leprosula]
MAIEHWSISISNLPRVVHDDDLRGEAGNFLGRIILAVGSKLATFQILNSNILHIEPNIVTRESRLEHFLLHLNRLNFSGETRRTKGHNHTWLKDTSFNTTDWDSSNATNLVDLLKGKTEWLVRGPFGLLHHVQSLKEGRTLVPVKVW